MTSGFCFCILKTWLLFNDQKVSQWPYVYTDNAIVTPSPPDATIQLLFTFDELYSRSGVYTKLSYSRYNSCIPYYFSPMLLLERVRHGQGLYISSLQLFSIFPLLVGDIHYSEGEKCQTNIMMERERQVKQLCNIYFYFFLSLSTLSQREGLMLCVTIINS